MLNVYTDKTAQKLAELENNAKLEIFYIDNVPATFDVNAFVIFMKASLI